MRQSIESALSNFLKQDDNGPKIVEILAPEQGAIEISQLAQIPDTWLAKEQEVFLREVRISGWSLAHMSPKEVADTMRVAQAQLLHQIDDGADEEDGDDTLQILADSD